MPLPAGRQLPGGADQAHVQLAALHAPAVARAQSKTPGSALAGARKGRGKATPSPGTASAAPTPAARMLSGTPQAGGGAAETLPATPGTDAGGKSAAGRNARKSAQGVAAAVAAVRGGEAAANAAHVVAAAPAARGARPPAAGSAAQRRGTAGAGASAGQAGKAPRARGGKAGGKKTGGAGAGGWASRKMQLSVDVSEEPRGAPGSLGSLPNFLLRADDPLASEDPLLRRRPSAAGDGSASLSQRDTPEMEPTPGGAGGAALMSSEQLEQFPLLSPSYLLLSSDRRGLVSPGGLPQTPLTDPRLGLGLPSPNFASLPSPTLSSHAGRGLEPFSRVPSLDPVDQWLAQPASTRSCRISSASPCLKRPAESPGIMALAAKRARA